MIPSQLAVAAAKKLVPPGAATVATQRAENIIQGAINAATLRLQVKLASLELKLEIYHQRILELESLPPSPVKTARPLSADTHAASGKTKKGEGGV